MAWLALAAAGSRGRPIVSAASSRAGVAPGLTAKRQPWSKEAWSWSRLSTVPEPTVTSGSASAMAAMAASAGSLRRVISSTVRPPRASAVASGTALARSWMTMTGITTASSIISATRRECGFWV